MDNTVSKRNVQKVPRRLLGSLLSGISAGVVPRSGAPYIAIGRVDEIRALSDDLDRVSEGGSAMRLVIGRYGSGKSFLLQLLRSRALETGFVTADADLSPERKLSGEGGIATYRELARNLSCKASPEGGAWTVLLTRFVSDIAAGMDENLPEAEYREAMRKEIAFRLRPLTEEVGGYDYAAVISRWCGAYLSDDEEIMGGCLRWLRGEFRTKTEARTATGIRTLSVIDDASWYTAVRLLSIFVRIMGQRGLLVLIDECVNLYKISNRISRESNYEKILSMYNDTLQGVAQGLMIVLGGTPRFLEDSRRGLFSYEALRSRLADARFAENGEMELKNMMSPVIRLRRLSDNELYALCLRLRSLHEQYYGTENPPDDVQTEVFLRDELSRAGADEMVTPREIIRDYVTLLDLLYQNPGASFESVLKTTLSASASGTDDESIPDGGEDSGGETTQPPAGKEDFSAPIKVALEDIEL